MTTPAQCYQALRDVSQASKGKKMPASVAATLTAIAGAESGWNLHVLGDVNLENATWGPSYGLWQIRTLKAQTGRGTARDIKFLKGGLYNQAAAAYQVWTEQGLRAWSTYKSGSYKRFSAQARANTGKHATKPGAKPGAATLTPGAPGGNGVGNGGSKSSPGPSYIGGGDAGMAETAGFTFPNNPLDPLNWAGSLGGGAAASAASAVWGQIEPFAITGLFVVGGIALFVVGAAITAQPARQRVQASAQEAAGDAAQVAKIGAVLA